MSFCSLLSYLCLLVLLLFGFLLTFQFLSLRSTDVCHRGLFYWFFRRMLNNDAMHLFLPGDIKSSFHSVHLFCYRCRMWYAFLFLGLNICHKNYVRTIKFTAFSDVLFRSSQFAFIRFPPDNMSKLFDICRLYDLSFYLYFVIWFEIFITSDFQPRHSSKNAD